MIKKIFLTIFILLISGCTRDMREKTLEMIRQQKMLNEMCKQRPNPTHNKFTGSGSTIKMECESPAGFNSEEMQKILLQNRWIENQRTGKSILYCLTDRGIALVTSLDDGKQQIETIMQYPSASCGSAFSIYRMK
jgi:hypothetical protein